MTPKQRELVRNVLAWDDGWQAAASEDDGKSVPYPKGTPEWAAYKAGFQHRQQRGVG